MVASRPAVAAAAVTALAAGFLVPAADSAAKESASPTPNPVGGSNSNSNKSVPVPHCHQSDTPKVGNS